MRMTFGKYRGIEVADRSDVVSRMGSRHVLGLATWTPLGHRGTCLGTFRRSPGTFPRDTLRRVLRGKWPEVSSRSRREQPSNDCRQRHVCPTTRDAAMKQARPMQHSIRRREWAGLSALARLTLAPSLGEAIERWDALRAFRAEASNHLREVRRDCNPNQLRELAVDLGFNRVFAARVATDSATKSRDFSPGSWLAKTDSSWHISGG